MDIDSPMLIILFSTGFMYVLGGLIVFLKPPKTINALYGYRTNRSMRNQKIWDYAQILGSKAMIFGGLIMISIGLISSVLNIKPNYSLLFGIFILMLVTVIIIIITE